jgi:hypothetical protein
MSLDVKLVPYKSVIDKTHQQLDSVLQRDWLWAEQLGFDTWHRQRFSLCHYVKNPFHISLWCDV